LSKIEIIQHCIEEMLLGLKLQHMHAMGDKQLLLMVSSKNVQLKRILARTEQLECEHA
jgi:hypothetical protein